jgi:hypothetical protein
VYFIDIQLMSLKARLASKFVVVRVRIHIFTNNLTFLSINFFFSKMDIIFYIISSFQYNLPMSHGHFVGLI